MKPQYNKSHRSFHHVAAVLIAAGIGMATLTTIAAAAQTPPPLKYRDYNLVFVSFDALQSRHVHSLGYGRDITPTIDAMAREGFSFTNAISVSSWTVPASMTWFTGVYPSEHRLLNKYAVYAPPVEKVAKLRELAPEIVTLAEILKDKGYVTGGFTGDAGVSGGFGYNLGFDVYEDKVPFGDMEQSVPKALAWVKENRDKKFFLFLHGYDSHGQCVPAEGFDYRFVDPGYDRKFKGTKEEQEALREEGLEKGRVELRDSDVAFWRAIYDEKINRSDSRFKKFLDGLDALGLTNKTLFVLTSDHGTEFYEHQRFDHGFSLFDELVHVPLVIKLPDRPDGGSVADAREDAGATVRDGAGATAPDGGKTIPQTVSSIDVMPTVLDLLDISPTEKVGKQLRGTSLVPALRGEQKGGDVFAETDYRLYTFKRSIQTQDGWKFIQTMETKAKELYNLNMDPNETKNLVETEPRRAYELEQKLFAHFKAIGHDLATERWETGLSPVYPSQAKGAQKK